MNPLTIFEQWNPFQTQQDPEKQTVINKHRDLLLEYLKEEELKKVQELPFAFDHDLLVDALKLGLKQYFKHLYYSEMETNTLYLHEDQEGKPWFVWSTDKEIEYMKLEKNEYGLIVSHYYHEKGCGFRNGLASIMSHYPREIIHRYPGMSIRDPACISTEIAYSLLPITVRISRAAAQKLLELPKELGTWNLDAQIAVGPVDPEDDGLLTTNLLISKDFLCHRLLKVHQAEGCPEWTSERVAPAVVNRVAFEQLKTLRGVQSLDKYSGKRLDRERCFEILEGETEARSDLRAGLGIGVKDGEEEFSFVPQPVVKNAEQEELRLEMDYAEGWKLKSTYYQKV